MFGKRNAPPSEGSLDTPEPGSAQERSGGAASSANARPANLPANVPTESAPAAGGDRSSSTQSFSGGEDRYLEVKSSVFNALVEAVDLTELGKLSSIQGKLSSIQVREEITDIVGEIISMQNQVLSAAEQQKLISDICNDVLGLGPLEPLIARDDIADIMVNGCDQVYIEADGIIEHTDIHFRDNAQLMNICQRIVAPSAGGWTRPVRFVTPALPMAVESMSSCPHSQSTVLA